MARKKLNMITLQNWQECDEALRQIGEHNRDIMAIENVMNEQIAAAKGAAAAKAAPLREQIGELELAIRDFAMRNRGDMDGRKSKILTFGRISFRTSTKIVLPNAKEQLTAIINRLKGLGMTDCINQPDPKVDKDALKKHSAERIAEVGASLKIEDTFSYEVNEERLES